MFRFRNLVARSKEFVWFFFCFSFGGSYLLSRWNSFPQKMTTTLNTFFFNVIGKAAKLEFLKESLDSLVSQMQLKAF